jgi:hypothetical protein
MLTLQNYNDRLLALTERWGHIEVRIKEAEQIRDEVVIPAINEIRYAGRRFFEAWLISINPSPTEKDEEDFQAHINMAEQYFNNADHDITDAIISFLSQRTKHVLSKYMVPRITRIYPPFVAFKTRIDEAEMIVRSARGHRQERMTEYARLERDFHARPDATV